MASSQNGLQNVTDKCSEVIDNLVGDKTKTIEEVADKFSKIHEKVKYKSFGKVTLPERRQNKPQGDTKKDDDDEGKKAKKLAQRNRD